MRLAGNLHAELLLGLALRGAGAVSSFALIWLIAQMFGAEVVGLFQFGIAGVTLLGMIGVFGNDLLLVREWGVQTSGSKPADNKAFFRSARWFVWLFAALLSAAFALLAYPLGIYVLDQPRLPQYLILLAPAIIFLASLRLTSAALRSNGKLFLSQSLEGVFYTTVTASVLALGWIGLWSVTENQLLLTYLAATAGGCVISLFLAQRVVTGWPDGGISRWHVRAGAKIAIPPIIAPISDWIILFMVTTILGIIDTGVYRTAFQFGILFQLVTTSIATMVAPRLARAIANQDGNAIDQTLSAARRFGLAICLPVAIIVLISAEWLLSLFGPEFVRGTLALQMLVIAQLIAVGFGPLGVVLIMAHREKPVLVAEIVAGLTGIIVALLSVPAMGLTGAAMGVLISMLISRMAQYVLVRRERHVPIAGRI